MKINPSEHGTDNNLRDLMATISVVAFECATDTEEAYEIACLVFLSILKDASLKTENLDRRFAATSYPH